MSFKLEQLRYLVAVAEEGQFTRAARNLHVAQPALSQAISQLENDLGIELLQRHARGVTPTPAGEIVLAKARVALAATKDAQMTARSLARSATRMVEFGFLGSPPMIEAPYLFAAFAAAHPEAELSYRGLAYPRGSTASWLADVDVALCHSPKVDKEVHSYPLWAEPRFVLAPETHPLATRSELGVEDVLEETYLGFDPDVDPAWAGFWTLDDHRGGPAPRVTPHRARSWPAAVAIIASSSAITTVPACQATVIDKILTGVVTIPLTDADPTVLSLVWRRDNHNPLVHSLVAVAKGLTDGDGAGRKALHRREQGADAEAPASR
jgi:DNA-binding transcriptional LysR family regulator